MKILKRVFNGEIKGIDEKERTLTAYVSTGARDRMDEVLEPGGVDLKQYKKNPIVLWAHDYSMPPIGKALWIKKDGEGIISKMQFANTEFAQEIFGLYKDGFMKAFSVGFIPKSHTDGDGEKTPRRTYNKWEMLEYSAVPVPANPEALTLAISKGLTVSDNMKKILHIADEKPTEDEDVIEEEAPAEEEKPIEEAPVIEEEAPKETINDEILEENKKLKKENFSLKNDLLTLRFRLLQLDKKKEKTLSGMTDGEILSKVEEITVGVVRKITGKVN